MSDKIFLTGMTAEGMPNKPPSSKWSAPSELSATPCSANPPGVDVAHRWLKKSREEANGPISQWTTDEMDRYHTDLGLLVDFVTDYWPNDESSHSPIK